MKQDYNDTIGRSGGVKQRYEFLPELYLKRRGEGFRSARQQDPPWARDNDEPTVNTRVHK